MEILGTMELFCVRLMRNQHRCLPAYLTRSFQTSHCRQRQSTTRRTLPSTELYSTNTCRILRQPETTDSVCQLQLRPSSSQRQLFSSENVRTVLFPVGTPRPDPAVHCLPVIWLPKHGQNFFHTSAPHRALPAPLIWLVLKPLQKIVAIILGRSIRKWWWALPPNKQQLVRQKVWRRRWQLVAGGMVAMVIMASFFLTHLDESPITGRTRLLVFSRENYMELATVTGDGYMEEFAELMVPEKDPRHQVVERVVEHLAQRNKDIPEVSSVPWRVHLVDSPTINAFVLPNGKVFMFTGMLEAVADVHQLTFILGHEMAHAVMGHSAEQASMSHVVDFLSLILLTAIWAVCPRDSLAVLGQWIQTKLIQFLFDRPYSRKLEAEADQVGLQLAAKACADVRAGPVFWQQMEISDQLRGEPTVPEWLSTHPSHRNRVAQLDRLVPQYLELRERCSCPALPATDPRAVFAQSVKVLLDATRDLEGEAGKSLKPQALSQTPTSDHRRAPHPGGLATALLASSATGSPPALTLDTATHL
ncbi:metalloendopeptidase OMA1, mitochondrial isoform X1 [Oncorhynchus kisutch]|uniref:Metalloendopeptidase OMA1, mitochondrial n=2 Tax=Oncorhynchus kisutch TaxID=8019 RepID=A0A8C7GMB3_ONCKI|nr:metalloendopeptidase OMA1, mitochondrial isoform X1 [Oncorhynchus kisutch]XP_031689297.1 metalloendopeptidase OMA1, mitochondrial isoform X1 [Oncorhynchus kisutch]